MSAEGKKKRGLSGVANAKNNPFRMNGRAPDWMARSAGAYAVGPAPSSGSVTMRGLVGGMLAARLGFPLYGQYTDRMMKHAQDRCTHSLLRDV